jgi:hypothetical protein
LDARRLPSSPMDFAKTKRRKPITWRIHAPPAFRRHLAPHPMRNQHNYRKLSCLLSRRICKQSADRHSHNGGGIRETADRRIATFLHIAHAPLATLGKISLEDVRENRDNLFSLGSPDAWPIQNVQDTQPPATLEDRQTAPATLTPRRVIWPMLSVGRATKPASHN